MRIGRRTFLAATAMAAAFGAAGAGAQAPIEGELTLIEDDGETVLRAGDCAAFPKGTGNGHHLINRGTTIALYLEVGSRHPDDLTTCSDIDMMSANADGRFVHKDGTPYPEP